ncbi:hypothetical protein B296_00045666 [Ensete ventricosum]|uniref:Uncharacterized protein n=1 Tax=Ensete ventricosum TaxID=4639 RepID=A0A426WXH2_ENSVE|nr:hypothetical protein B296_00045666 [Ensete ventricosum]
MPNLTQVRLIPLPVDASLTARMAGVVEVYDDIVSHNGSLVVRRRAHVARTPVWGLGYRAPPGTSPPSTNRGGHGSCADSQPLLEDDDRPWVPVTRIQPRVVHGHVRGFPRPHQPSPSTSGDGADHNPIPVPARAFDGSPIGSPGGTPASGVTSSPKPGNPARHRGATTSGRRSPCCFPDPDASPIKEVLKSREEVGESSKGGSPFTPEIQAKPLPATFRLPALKPYDGSGDPAEHIATFRAQMAIYDTSEALMCRAFPTTLRESARN